MPSNGHSKHNKGAVQLPLVPGRKQESLGFSGALALLISLSIHLLFFLPIRTVASYTLLRLFSPSVRIGRPIYVDAFTKLIQFFFSRATVAQARVFFNSQVSYHFALALPLWTGYRDWVKRVEVNGTAGRWIAKPGTARHEDDVVIYHVHGGGFTTDTGAAAQALWLKTVKAVKEKQGLNASVFSLDYRLAPEYKYPSQLIETLAGYHYLVNTLGVSPAKIVVVGDSAGGALVTSFLLHLARPSPDIHLPSELGDAPTQPGGALLLSPEVAFASLSTSSRINVPFDVTSLGFCFRGAFDYVGARLPFTHRFRTRWAFNPLWHLIDPQRLPPVPADELADYKGLLGWNEIEHVELLKSPYVQPSVNKDSSWCQEAFPGDGRTVVSWGGIEVLSDDVEGFFRQLEKAGVKPVKLFKPYGVHTWPILEAVIPGLWKSSSSGPDRKQDFGLNAIVKLLKTVSDNSRFEEDKAAEEEETAKTTAREEKASATSSRIAKAVQPPTSGTSFASAAASTDTVADDAPIVASGEGKRLEGHLEDGKIVTETKKPEAASHIPVLTKPNVDTPPPTPKQTSAPTPAVADEAPKPKSKKKAKKPVAPVPSLEEGGSYAAAANSKAVADDAPVVAKGEGDALVPELHDGHVSARFSQSKAERAAKNRTGKGVGSWASVAKTEPDEDAPVVGEGEGGKLKSTLDHGVVVTERA